MKRTIISFSAAALLAGAAASIPVSAAEYVEQADTRPSAPAMLADLVVARPLGLVATVAGTAIFIVGLPFEALSGDISGPAQRLVVEPVKFTFTRPLGEAP